MSIDTDGLHPFFKYVLRKYYQTTGWNDDNLYGNLSRASDCAYNVLTSDWHVV